MADLRGIVESLGHRDVATFIQSGNVVFAADDGSEPADEDRLGESIRVAIAERLGLEVDVMVRGRPALERILAAVPYPDADPKQLLVAFLATTPAPEARQALDAVEAAPGRGPGRRS